MIQSLLQDVAAPTYLDFFGLSRPPFAQLDDPSQLYHTEQYALLIEHLDNTSAQADSLLVVCGADGSGKSTLLNYYTAGIDEHIIHVLIDETCKDEIQFYTAFLTQIGFEDISGTLKELRNITKQFLVCRGIAGDHILVVFDNAHLTDPRVLKELRWLCQIKTKDRRVLSVVLVGNANLVRVMEAPAMREVEFQSHVVFSIRAYTEEETANYIWHRLRLAGGDEGVRLPQESYARIHRYSGGIPHLINDLCHAVLEEAHALKTRVVGEKIVRHIADKHELLPHVTPLHGKGRRRTDPDLHHLHIVPDITDDADITAVPQDGESAGVSADGAPYSDAKSLLQQIARLSEQVDDLRADKVRAIEDIEARNLDIIELRDELASQSMSVEELRRSLADDTDKIAQQNLLLSDSTAALEESETRSRHFAAELENEASLRVAAEEELAKATASVADLGQLKQELQTTVADLQAELEAGLRVADERAAAVEALEKNAAELRREREADGSELSALREELESRNQELADLTLRLEDSQKEREQAALRISDLEDPKELNRIRRTSNRRAADLRKQTRKRQKAEKQLAKATATVEELSQLKQELEHAVGDLQTELEVASDRAADFEILEKESADLRVELKARTGELESLSGELASLRDELESRNQELADLEDRLDESQKDREQAELRISDLKDPKELQKIKKTSNRRAADLRKQTRARKAAEQELATATATIAELGQMQQELQRTVGDLQAELEVARERAADFELLEKESADLKTEVEAKTGELESLRGELASLRDELNSRNEILADLEIRLDRSQSACELAQLRIVELKSPQELEEIERASAKLATDLEQERQARESAEGELAKATAAVDELSQLKEGLQAGVDSLQADLALASERVADSEFLESESTDLRVELEARTDELESLKGELASLQVELGASNQQLADLEIRLDESLQARELAENRIASLKDPQELEEVEKTAAELAQDLDQERLAREVAESELTSVKATADELGQLKQEMEATIEDLAANLATNTGDLESVRDELELRNEILADLEVRFERSQSACELAQMRIIELKSPQELEEIERASAELAADLEKERRARQSAESALAESSMTVDDLGQLKQEWQARIDCLQADLDAGLALADERADRIDVLEKITAALESEVENKTGELASRVHDLEDLENQLEESRAECRSASMRIAALKDPEELAVIEKTSDRLAADLDEERRRRESAEVELAKATATADELSQLKQAMQTTVDALQADIELRLDEEEKRAAEIETLEKRTADLDADIESRIVELDSLRQELDSANQRVADLEREPRAREEAEKELSEARSTIDGLRQIKRELQAKVHELNTDVRIAGDQAIEVYTLERSVADLKDEVANKTRELEARDRTLTDLEEQLAASRQECELLRSRAPIVSIDADSGSTEAEVAATRGERVQSSSAVEEFERSMQKVPAYKTLREYDSGLYSNLATKYRSLVERGFADKQVDDALRSEYAKLMERLLPRASDEAILAYAQLIVEQLDEFQLDGIEPCLTLLVPESDPDNDSMPVYSENTRERELDLLDLTLKTYNAVRPIPTEKDVWPDLEPKFADLFNAFGADNVAAMQNSFDPSIDRVLVCNVTRALYSGILSMPKRKVADSLRWLLST